MNVRLAPLWGVLACIAVVSCGGGSGGNGGYGGGGDGGGGGSGGSGNNPPPATVQYVAPADSSFVAAIAPSNPGTAYLAQLGTYAGARTFVTASLQTGSPTLTNSLPYSEIFKASDGHIYRLDLSITGSPTPQQVSSESNATIGDLCSLSGATAGLRTDVNYLAVQYFNDFANRTQTPVTLTSALYSMPLDGSAAPTQLATESGIIQEIAAPVGGGVAAYSIVPPKGFYTIRAVSSSGAQTPSVVTAVTTTGTAGSFAATTAAIYLTYENYSAPDSMTRIYANTSTGIVGMDGTVIEQPVANSKFIAQQSDNNGSGWLNVVRARNLTPVTMAASADGITYTEDGLSGATLEVVDTSTNTVTMTLGTLPSGTIMNGTGTLTGTAGYIDGLNVNSTLDPTTRDLLYIDTSTANSLQALTSNLH